MFYFNLALKCSHTVGIKQVSASLIYSYFVALDLPPNLCDKQLCEMHYTMGNETKNEHQIYVAHIHNLDLFISPH